ADQGKRRRPLSPAGRPQGLQSAAGGCHGRARSQDRPIGAGRKSLAEGQLMVRRSVADPYRTFSKAEWSLLRNGQPMTLDAADIERLRSLSDPISLAEAEEIYLP